MTINIGILTVSDRASQGIYDDISGKAIINSLTDYLTSPWEAVYKVIPDDQHIVEQHLKQMADENSFSMIVFRKRHRAKRQQISSH